MARGRKKRTSLEDFKSWIAGIVEFQPDDWHPNLEEWAKIYSKINGLECECPEPEEKIIYREIPRDFPQQPQPSQPSRPQVEHEVSSANYENSQQPDSGMVNIFDKRDSVLPDANGAVQRIDWNAMTEDYE